MKYPHIRILFVELNREARQGALAASGMNVTQFAVMRAVERHENEPLSRVADDLAMERTSPYRALALERNNWIKLKPWPFSCRETENSAMSITSELPVTRANQERLSNVARALSTQLLVST